MLPGVTVPGGVKAGEVLSADGKPVGKPLASLDPLQSKYTDSGLTFAKGELNKWR